MNPRLTGSPVLQPAHHPGGVSEPVLKPLEPVVLPLVLGGALLDDVPPNVSGARYEIKLSPVPR